MLPFRCATCAFFAPHRPHWAIEPTCRGQCRRHAPVLDKEVDGRLRTLWPMVHEDNYCGEHAEIEVEVSAEQERPRQQPELDQTPVRQTGPAWRCVNCKEVEIGVKEPTRCVVCQCREFAKVDD